MCDSKKKKYGAEALKIGTLESQNFPKQGIFFWQMAKKIWKVPHHTLVCKQNPSAEMLRAANIQKAQHATYKKKMWLF